MPRASRVRYGRSPAVIAGKSCVTGVDSCLDLLNTRPGLPSGLYWIDPDRNGTGVQAYCDMTTDGGGYTFYKVDYGSGANAAQAELACAAMGMRLFIPRTDAHVRSAYTVATGSTLGPSASVNYLYILGIYPNSNGATCSNRPLRSGEPGCNWRAGDNGRFFVGTATNISEPNGDNCTTCSMYYGWNAPGVIGWYNDISSPGYTSQLFMCDVADKP